MYLHRPSLQFDLTEPDNSPYRRYENGLFAFQKHAFDLIKEAVGKLWAARSGGKCLFRSRCGSGLGHAGSGVERHSARLKRPAKARADAAKVDVEVTILETKPV